MKDSRGVEVNIGDTVCYSGSGSTKNFSTGVVMSFTKTGAKVQDHQFKPKTDDDVRRMSYWTKKWYTKELEGLYRGSIFFAVCTLPEIPNDNS